VFSLYYQERVYDIIAFACQQTEEKGEADAEQMRYIIKLKVRHCAIRCMSNFSALFFRVDDTAGPENFQ